MRALLVVAGLVGCFAGVAAAAESTSTSASMSVLLTVARTCTVVTLDATVTLQCSRGVNSVSVNTVSSAAPSEVRPIVSGTNLVTVSSEKAATPKPKPVVILNF